MSARAGGRWVRNYDNGPRWAENLDGVEWHKAPLPGRDHRCKPQTRGSIDGSYVERCPCGATRLGGCGGWIGVNQTRNLQEQAAREAVLPRVTVTCRDCDSGYEAGEGTPLAAAQQCTACWARAFLADRAPGGQ